MKTILIAGVPRSGKSTIAKKILHTGIYVYIPYDSIISTLQNLYPQLGITHYKSSRIVSKKISQFLEEFITHITYENLDTIIDIYQLYPEDITNSALFNKKNIIYTGYPTISIEQKYNEIRTCAKKGDWTEYIPEKELKKHIKKFVDESVTMQKQCQKYNLKFFDTGRDFSASIAAVLQYLEE
jgi:hypothetical protein